MPESVYLSSMLKWKVVPNNFPHTIVSPFAKFYCWPLYSILNPFVLFSCSEFRPKLCSPYKNTSSHFFVHLAPVTVVGDLARSAAEDSRSLEYSHALFCAMGELDRL